MTIKPSDIRGIWLPLLSPWDAQWRLDERTGDANLERLIASGPDGLYTLDTSSEFYTMEFDEWRGIAHRFVQRCRAANVRFPIGLGCTWTNQEGALRRVREARDLGVEVIHLSPPYWLPLPPEGLIRFYAAVQACAGHLGVIIYAPNWGKIGLTAALYRALVDAAPCIVGTKSDRAEGLLDLRIAGRRHSHFVHEQRMNATIPDGASGCYSALAGASVRYMRNWIARLEDGRQREAEARDAHVQAFYAEAVQPLRDRGIIAGAIDKALAQIGGFAGSRQLRPPYVSVPDDLYDRMVTAAHRHLPEVFAEEAN
jgi:dihydrodipicolinate synthase/N-acetylneuraminate lyase